MTRISIFHGNHHEWTGPLSEFIENNQELAEEITEAVEHLEAIGGVFELDMGAGGVITLRVPTVVRRTSILSGREQEMELPVSMAEIEAWERSGRLIQHALPHLSDAEREFVLNGILPDEWDRAMGVER